MDIIPRPIFDRVALKLPVNAKDLLRVGSMRIYDLLELLVNTVNAVVKANDGNIDKEEKFLAALNEALDSWATDREAEIGKFKDEIMNFVISGEFDTEGFVTSPLSFETNFWNELSHGMMTGARVLAPHDEDNGYDTGDKWVVRFDMKNNLPIYLNVEKLMNNIQLELNNTDGAVITDNNKDFEEIGRIPFATQEQGGLFHKDDKAKLDGIYVDESNRLHIGDKVYTLEPYEEQPSDRTYLAPQILELSYLEGIPEDGGVARPFVQVSQQVLVGTNVKRRIFVVATYQWDAGQQKMVTTYENEEYNKDGGGLSLVFDFDSDSVGAEMSADGIVEYNGHATTTRTRMGTVTVQATMNGIQADEEMFEDVYQEASEAGAPAIITENTSGTAIVGLAFGNCLVNEASASKTIVVKGENLTDNITAKINNSRYQFVTEGENVDQIVIDKDEAMGAGKELQVVFIPNTTGATSNANITLTSGNVSKVVTLSGTGVVPTLIVAPTSLTFSDKAVNGSYTGTFTVRGQYLKGNIALSLSQDAAAFSIDRASISKSEAGSAVTVTVTYAPTTVGSSSETITITSDGAASKTVTLSGNAVSGEDTMTAYYGAGETIPAALGSNMFSLVSGTNTKKIEGYAKVHWVAVPSSLPVVVTGADTIGNQITVNTDSSAISGYTLYYRQVFIPIDETTFTIVV